VLTIPYPAIDPVLFAFGPLVVRWYALAYIAGLLIGWRYCLWIASHPPQILSRAQVDDFLTWATLGVILGGRAGYVLFYKPGYYLENPGEIVALWHGGMSFHGGALGVLAALFLFCRQRKISFLGFADIIACAVPIGLFFGRLANFINGELWGRVTDVPWAMVFCTKYIQLQNSDSCPAGLLPRHPSQLYEAGLEGVALFLLLFALLRCGARKRPGMICGTFLLGYGVARITVEFFRQPDANLGFLYGGATMGQLLSLPLLVIGAWLIWRARAEPPLA
jgi:phosphatidylglycerol:prolipoprotein diacylglycerol transferase